MDSAPRPPFWRRATMLLGPGLIWAMTSIGQTHVIVSTYGGARHGFTLLWIVVLAHVLGYPVFEYGARYAVATGTSIIEAYVQMRRARVVLFPFFGVLLLTIPFLILAALLSVVASLLVAAFPGLFGAVEQTNFIAWCILTTVLTGGLVFAGSYRGLEVACIAMSGVLLVGTLVAFGLEPPSPSAMAGGLLPAIPAGGLLTLVALMRLPSDSASSLMLSAWAVQKRDAWMPEGDTAVGIRRGVLDLRIGYGLSFVVAIVFLALGATVLYPRGVDLEGIGLALELSKIYTETVGAWTFPLFIGVAFTAIWGSYYSTADGVPRMMEGLVFGAFGRQPPTSGSLLRKGYTVLIMLGALGLAVRQQNPVFLVLFAVSTGLVAYPLIYVLNLFAVTRMLPPEHRPSRLSRTVAWAGVVYALVGAVLLVLTRVFHVGAA